MGLRTWVNYTDSRDTEDAKNNNQEAGFSKAITLLNLRNIKEIPSAGLTERFSLQYFHQMAQRNHQTQPTPALGQAAVENAWRFGPNQQTGTYFNYIF